MGKYCEFLQHLQVIDLTKLCHFSVATCAFDDDIPSFLVKQLSSLRSSKPKHPNLRFDGDDYDLTQGDGADDIDDEDEPLDPDGAGADVSVARGDEGMESEDEGEGENEGEGESESGGESGRDTDGERPAKRMRLSADAGLTLIGLESGFIGMGRISRSSSASHNSSPSPSPSSPPRSPSVSSSRSATSIS